MTAPTVLELTQQESGADFDIDHIYCSYCSRPGKVLCGLEIPDEDGECPPDCSHEECVVCADLLQTHVCPGS